MGWSTVILCTLLAVLSLGLTADAHNQRRCSATSISYAGKNAYFPQTSCNRVAKWKCPSGKWLERTCICKSGSAPRWSTLRGSCTGSSGCPAQAAMDLSGVTIGQLSAAASGKSCNVRCPSSSTSVTYENEEDLRQYNQTFYSNALLSGVAVYQTIELPELTGAPCYEYIYHQAIFPTLTTSPVSLAFLCYYLAGGNYTVDLTSYSLYIQAGNPIGVNLYLAFITKKREAGTLPEIGMDGDREEGSLVESEEEILERERRAITFGWAAKTFIRRCRFPPPNC
eukprot:Colp12_sorted_trinity150504_noHs@5698